jgi:rhomboid protease GluP
VVAREEDFATRAGSGLIFLAASLIGGAALWGAMIAFARVDLKPRTEAPAETHDSVWRALFLPTRANYGLPLLVDTNIAVYLAMALSGAGVMSVQSDDLIAWGGNYAPALHGMGWLRLLTSQFVHAGAMHIINNMYGLLVAAIFLAPAARNAWLLLAYLLCGLGGSLASTWVHPDTVSVGASGAIFGLYGIAMMLTLLGDAHFEKIRKPILLNAAAFVVINLVLGALTPGIDNAAHVGGLAVGAVLGAVFFAVGRSKAEG